MTKKNPIAVEIGLRVKKRRKDLGLTQEIAAEKCGLSHQFFACMERGIKSIRAESIIKISRGLNISTDYLLLGNTGDIEKNTLIAKIDHLDEFEYSNLQNMIDSFVAVCEREK